MPKTYQIRHPALWIMLACLYLLSSVGTVLAQNTDVTPANLEDLFNPGQWDEQIKPLPQLPGGWELIPESIVVSPNRQRMACKMQRGSGIIVVIDGKPSPVYRKVGQLTFSANSVNLYYVARELGGWFLVRDFSRRATREFVSDPILSDSGKRCAVVYKTPQRLQLYIEGHKPSSFDEIDTQSICFSPDDKQFAYFARRGTAWYVQINEQTAGPYELLIDTPVFNSDSTELAYMAQHNGECYVVQNNEPWAVANEVTGLQYHPVSGELYAWLRVEKMQWQLYCDNKPVTDAVSTTPAKLVFGSHPDTWATRLTVGSHTQLMRSGKLLPIEGYILPDSIQFDPKSIQLVYVTRTDAGEHITVDGQLLDPYQAIQTTDIRISRNALRIAYVAKKDNRWCVVDQGQPGPVLDTVIPNSLMFSHDNQQLIYRTQNGPFQRLYVDNQMVGEFDEMTEPVYARQHMAFAARMGNEWHLYVDGIANPTGFTDLVAQPQISTQYGRFITLIQQNHTLMPTYSKLVMEILSNDEALANVNPDEVK